MGARSVEEMVRRCTSCIVALQFLILSLHDVIIVHPFAPSTPSRPSRAPPRRPRPPVGRRKLSAQRPETADPSPLETAAEPTPASSPRMRALRQRQLTAYSAHWDGLLRREYAEANRELNERRKSYTRAQLEGAGLVLFHAVATPETELCGEKILRITLPLSHQSNKYRANTGEKKLRDKFKRGDVLLLTPQIQFQGRDIVPREGLVMDAGTDYLLLGVGTTWPSGVMEMRKHDLYRVRLDKSLSAVPLRAQTIGLELLRKGNAGTVAEVLARLFYDDAEALGTAKGPPRGLYKRGGRGTLEERIARATEEASEETSFEPNPSQREAVASALSRTLGLIRGPPGTGKTRCSALLIATALKMTLKDAGKSNTMEEDDEEGARTPSAKGRAPRVLAVTHSNGAADVLLSALLQMGVPAVRAGRPASVDESLQHRTIAALAERMPEAVRLRQQAGDATLDALTRQLAIYDAKQYRAEAQTTIARSAPAVVASCIGAQQLLATLGEIGEGGGSSSPSSFDVVVLDEAGQATEPALMCAIAAARARQVILVGDTKQLPPTVTTQDVELRKTIGISPMERLLRNGLDEFVLTVQYRMPKALLRHPNDYFYEGLVKCATASVAYQNQRPPEGFPWPSPNKEPLAFLHVGRDSEVLHGFGGRTNPTEVEVVVDIVQKVIAADDVNAEDIAIITPYSKQVQLFRNELTNANRNTANNISRVRVGTVDSFQGQETDLVLFSAVRSNLLRELGFLRDARRLNVAITRARRGLIVVGDPTVLHTCRHWSALLDSCEKRGCVLTKDEYDCQSRRVEAVSTKARTMSVELDMDDEFFGLFSDDGEDDDLADF